MATLTTARITRLWAALSLGAALTLGAGGGLATAASPARPVLVELFTAQGCAACPDANKVVAELADRPGVLALTFPVDYWDYLGWSDTFAQPEFTARQRAYQSRFRLREIYTPEVIVAGSKEAAGSDKEKLHELIEDEGRRARRGPQLRITRQGERVSVGSGAVPRGGLEAWLIRYDPMRREVKVDRGENRGRTVVHRNLVREVVRLGTWSGQPRVYKAPAPKSDDLVSIVVLQEPRGGRVWSIARR